MKGTNDYGLFYKKGDSNSELIEFIDNDFVGYISDWKSTFSHIFFLRVMAVNWWSQKHNIVALFSCEAYYIGARAATSQAMWMNCLISEMKGEEQTTMRLMVDNQIAITLS